MKKLISVLLILSLLLTFVGCSSNTEEKTDDSSEILDLTSLSSTMVYVEVYCMVTAPEDYIGKTIIIEGTFASYEYYDTDEVFVAVIVTDATACCSQGIEFSMAEDLVYPDDFPEVGSTVTVQGIFETYEYGDYTYCRLADAEIL